MDARISAGDQQVAGQLASLEQALAALRAEMPSAGGFQQAVDENLRRHAEQVGALDQKLTVLQEELPPKIKAIVDAVRESLDARMAIELQSIEERRAAHIQQAEARIREAQEQFHQQLTAESRTPELEQKLAKLQADWAAADERLAADLRSFEERHNAHAQQLEVRLDAAESETPALEEDLAKLRTDLSTVDSQQRQQLAGQSKTAELEQSLAMLQGDVAAMDFRLEASGRQVTDRLTSLEQHAGQITAGMANELESLRAEQRNRIEQLEARLETERAAENVPARIETAVAGLRQSLESKVASEIYGLESRIPDRSGDLDKALQYTSLLEARVQALEQKLHQSAEETVGRAVERVWQALESRLQQLQTPPPAVPQIPTISGLRQKSTSAEQSVMDLIAGLGQLFEKPAPRVTHATTAPEPAAAPVLMRDDPAVPAKVPVAPAHAEPAPAADVEPEDVAAAHIEPEPAHFEPETAVAADATLETGAATASPDMAVPEPQSPQAEANAEPEPETPGAGKVELVAKPPETTSEAAPIAAAGAVEEGAEPKPEEKPPVILFKPRDSGRKWRIPFVSSFL